MTLEINKGEEYKIKIENTDKFNNSIFKDVYNQAANSVDEIIRNFKLQNTLNKSISNEDYNNLIAFTGERGSGKSSSMISFVNSLKTNNSSFFKDFDNITNFEFACLDIIDPSLFRNDDKLFEIIISKMFSKFQIDLKNSPNKIRNNHKRELIKKFQQVFNNLKVVHNGKSEVYDKEAIEALSDLAYGTNLKNNFKDLVNEYLYALYNINNTKNKIEGALVITIDDFDLNISGAFDMLEDIRQFLIQNNIIILIASKIEQLQDSIELKTYSSFSNYKGILSDSPEDMANRYLEKLIPLTRRLPVNTAIQNYDQETIINTDPKISTNSIQKAITKLIYNKTKLFLPNTEVFMTRTLRELNAVCSYLDSKNSYRDLKNLLLSNKSYFLNKTNQGILESLKTDSFSSINKYFINWVNSGKLKLPLNTKYRELTRTNNYKNVSLSDLNIVFNGYKEDINSSDYQSLKELNFIETYYNILNLEKNEIGLSDTIFLNSITNEKTNLFRKSLADNKNRDYFYFNNFDDVFHDIHNESDFIWITSFIYNTGHSNRYRESNEILYKNIITFKNKNSQSWATFNASNFIIGIIQPSQFYNRIDGINLKENELFKNLSEYKLDNYHLFFNTYFISILIEEIKIVQSKYKVSLPENFADLLKLFINNFFTQALNNITKKFDFLDIKFDNFIDNPLLKYWNNNENSERLDIILNQIYNNQFIKSNYTEEDISMAKYLLGRYRRYFDEDGDFSQRGAKQAMNSVVKSFEEDSPIRENLQNWRYIMDQDFEEGLFGIQKELKSIN
ncbi:hypothetical protein ABMY20_00950 [Tenacibaculum sp. SSH1-16]|uniref:hypothetical protein n=1 Tax=Tenacibaculum sp. SSH1-16 TaxID=3136667 RepID=UPI0032C4355B